MQQTIRLEMDPKEWRSLIDLATKGKPKGEDEEAMSKQLKEKGEVIARASTVDIKDPF